MGAELQERIERANAEAIDRIVNAQPTWVDVVPARETIPDFPDNLILHAGPPIEPRNAGNPLRIALTGAAVHAGMAGTQEQAWKMIEAGEIALGSQIDHGGASGAANPVTAQTPVQICVNEATGTRGFCTFQESPSPNVLRWAVYNDEVEQRLTWFEQTLAPVLSQMLKQTEGGIGIRNILAKAQSMGDENHSRQVASTALLFEQMMPLLMDLDIPHATRGEVVKWLCSAERFFLHVFIAGASAVMQGVKGIEHCTLMFAQGGNGYEFGTKFGFATDRWFTAPCPVCTGMLLNPTWSMDIAGAYLGDSCVVETFGFGGNSSAAGPMVIRLTGGDLQEAMRRTERAREICVGTLDWALIPAIGFQGPPVGFDLRKIVATGITPVCHGGMHHLDGGQAGAGSMNVPFECFAEALRAFASRYGIEAG